MLLQIESEMMDVQRYIQGELAKCTTDYNGVAMALPIPDDDQAEANPLTSAGDENQSTDQLTRLLRNAKLDLRDRLKRPSSQERSPFAQLNN